MAARTAVVLAVHNEDDESADHDRLERDAIQNEADFDNAMLPGDDGGTLETNPMTATTEPTPIELIRMSEISNEPKIEMYLHCAK